MKNHYLIVGNWKLNPNSVEEAKKIAAQTRKTAAQLKRTDVVVCPPFPFISAAVSRTSVKHYSVGAQSVSKEESGPHTGLVSAYMLASLGVTHVIAGHSEARARGETNETVSQVVGRIVDCGMTAVVCVGEKTRDESGSHFEYVKNQIRQSLAGISAEALQKVVIAYEPIWAIGAKEAMAPGDVYEMSLFVKKVFADSFGQAAVLAIRVLYGGAVNFKNAADIMTIGRVDGLLVGRESVNVIGFTELLKVVDAIR